MFPLSWAGASSEDLTEIKVPGSFHFPVKDEEAHLSLVLIGGWNICKCYFSHGAHGDSCN